MFDSPGDSPLLIDFLLIPDFSMMAFTSAVEPLRAANRLSERELYQWRLISRDGSPVYASNRIAVVPSAAVNEIARSRVMFVVSGVDVQLNFDKRDGAFLWRMARSGAVLGALCTGSYILARAGLLTDRRCTIHWENLSGFVEEFPEIAVSSDIYEIDRDRVTCSGGTAALDMMLHLIGRHQGQALANNISEQFIHDRIRDPHDHQRMELRSRLGISHPKLIGVLGDMEENLEEPLSQTELAVRANLSTRQLERLFRKYLQATPTRYYLNLRLQRARHLLLQTSMSILSVALASGFVSASHFSKCYRECFGRTPRAERSMRHAVPSPPPVGVAPPDPSGSAPLPGTRTPGLTQSRSVRSPS